MKQIHRYGFLLAMLASGCSSDTRTADEDDSGDDSSIVEGYEPATLDAESVEQLSGFSAPNVFTLGVAVFTTAGLAADAGGCPVKTETETQATIEGGCTDDEGKSWYGTAVSSSSGISYDAFGYTGEDACGEGASGPTELTVDGRASMTPQRSEDVGFTVELTMATTEPDQATCEAETVTGAVDYAGSLQAPSGDGGPSTWNGSGEVGIDGIGRVGVATVDEHLDDDVCGHEALSGETSFSSESGDEAVISYEGAQDCDPEATVRWSLNGVDQGEMTGVSCAISPTGGDRSDVWLLALVGLAGLTVARRR